MITHSALEDVTRKFPDLQKWKWSRKAGWWKRQRLSRALYGTFCFELGEAFMCGSEVSFTVGQKVAIQRTFEISSSVQVPISGVNVGLGAKASTTVSSETSIQSGWRHQAERCECCTPIGCHSDSYAWEWIEETILPGFRHTTRKTLFSPGSRLTINPLCRTATADDCLGCPGDVYEPSTPPPSGDGYTPPSCNLDVVGFESASQDLPDVPPTTLENVALEFIEELASDPSERYKVERMSVVQPSGEYVDLDAHTTDAPFDFAVLSLDVVDRARASLRLRANQAPILIVAPAAADAWANIEVLRKHVPVFAMTGPHTDDEPLFADAEWIDQQGDTVLEAKVPLRVARFTAGWKSLPIPREYLNPDFALALRITMGARAVATKQVVLPIAP
jgi:hypothetical protein